MTAVLAMLASVVWGSSDFVGGLVSRRVRPLVVVGFAHVIAVATLVPIAAATGAFASNTGYLVWAAAAGAVGLVGLLSYYAALSTGTMGIVAPIAGAGAVVPVIVGLASGDTPSTWQYAGIAAAVGGVVLASGPELTGGGAGGRRPLVLAAVAAVAFGLVYTLIDKGSKHSVLMTLLAMRVVSVAIVASLAGRAVARGRSSHVPVAQQQQRPGSQQAAGAQRRFGTQLGAQFASIWPGWAMLGVIALVGWSDAGANGLYGLASRHGLVSVVAVLASLYPAVTVLLARIFDDERMRRIQAVGVVLALCGVVLLAAG
jgi:drug/metabolite transporter (DMT)-like permease